MRIQFTLGGKVYNLSTEEVEQALAARQPERIYELAVRVGDRWFPPKQALVTPIGLTNHHVNSHYAVNQLRKLGFVSHDLKSDGPLPEGSDAGSKVAERDGETREVALELAVGLLAGTGASAADATAAAEAFLAWLKAS